MQQLHVQARIQALVGGFELLRGPQSWRLKSIFHHTRAVGRCQE